MRSRNPSMADRIFVSKYGAITGPEYFRRRFNQQLEDWLPPAALHYVFTRTPAADENSRPIVHADFEYLARVNPEAAANQLITEAHAFFDDIPKEWRAFCWTCRRDSHHLSLLRPVVVLQVHHVIPVEDGGSDDPQNLQVLCAECHAEVHRRREAFKRYLASAPQPITPGM